MTHVKSKHQTISHSGVNAHFQNALAEKRIRDLQDAARIMLVHAKHRWPKAISLYLWPYALQMANDVHMSTPGVTGKAPIEMFSTVASATNPKHYHPFGCPVYALAARQQADDKVEKWLERARVGINIGMSPVHSRNVALVLSIETGHASPQSHIKHDDLFETVKSLNVSIMWHKCTGFASAISGEGDPTLQPPVEPINMPPLANKPANGDTAANESAPSVKPKSHHDNSISEGASPEPMFDPLSIAPDSTFDIGTPADQGGSNQDISSSVRGRSF
jgi:hypothetical protein